MHVSRCSLLFILKYYAEQNSEIDNLREMLNQSETRLNSEIADLRAKQNQSQNTLTTIQQELRDLQNSIAMVLYAKGTRENPARVTNQL